MTDSSGALVSANNYTPFGELTAWYTDPATTDETIGFIGERYDEDSVLQYLNARYYDPDLAMFIQPVGVHWSLRALLKGWSGWFP